MFIYCYTISHLFSLCVIRTTDYEYHTNRKHVKTCSNSTNSSAMLSVVDTLMTVSMFKMGYEIFSDSAKLSSTLVPSIKSDPSLRLGQSRPLYEPQPLEIIFENLVI